MAVTTTSSWTRSQRGGRLVAAALVVFALLVGACGSGDTSDATAAEAPADDATTGDASHDETDGADEHEHDEADVAAGDDTSEPVEASDTADGADGDEVSDDGQVADIAVGCEAIAALFGTDGSANPDLADPESSATCDGDMVVISSNAIPDYTYIETSPGPPRAQDLTYTIPAEPTVAAETTAATRRLARRHPGRHPDLRTHRRDRRRRRFVARDPHGVRRPQRSDGLPPPSRRDESNHRLRLLPGGAGVRAPAVGVRLRRLSDLHRQRAVRVVVGADRRIALRIRHLGCPQLRRGLRRPRRVQRPNRRERHLRLLHDRCLPLHHRLLRG